MYYVYALIDPINRLPFYIGKGKGNRAETHLKGTDQNNNSRKTKMIHNIRMLGHEPRIIYLEENINDEDYAYQLEYSIINLAIERGVSLTNRAGVDLRPPSRRGCKISEETKKKIVAANLRRTYKPLSEEHKRKLSIVRRGIPHPHALKISKDILWDMYITKNMTRKAIAHHFETSLFPINRLLKEYGMLKDEKNINKEPSRE